jgi:hypothetical protein
MTGINFQVHKKIKKKKENVLKDKTKKLMMNNDDVTVTHTAVDLNIKHLSVLCCTAAVVEGVLRPVSKHN